MKKTISKTILLGAVIVLFLGAIAASFALGYRQGGGADSVNVAESTPSNFGLFWQAWNIVNDDFYGPKDDTKRIDGAIGGMVASLGDPHTVYLPPDQSKMFQDDLDGNFGGIGAVLSVKNGELTVVSALDGTPAQKAGLQGQDVITEIDGKKTGELSFNDAVEKIRGEKGETVKLTIVRSGVADPFVVPIKRDTIVVKSVETSTIGTNNETAYIKVNQFGEDTTGLLKSAFTDAKNSNKKGIVLDLRNNPGGYLESAISTIGMIIPNSPASSEQNLKDRIAVLERDKSGGEQKHKASGEAIIPEMPMVVLVDSGSASASEIVAGALKDYKRATIVGVTTYGKGSVQELHDLSNGGTVKVTVAKWFTPLGVGIDGKGITPDVIVKLPDQVVSSKSDIQVQKALEILRQ